MADTVFKFGGIDVMSRIDTDKGEAEPDSDPRTRTGATIVGGMHMMSAVEQLQPSASGKMAYFHPGSDVGGLDELERQVREGEVALSDVLTMTDRFRPLVNPRRSREKDRGERSWDSDGDLWHVPTSNYVPITPRTAFAPLASSIDSNDNLANEGVYGEFRERRAGGEVTGNIWFEDFSVGALDSDPVLLGFEVGWSYYGDRAFYIQPWAQQTRCKNSVAPLDDKTVITHQNRSVDFREVWDEAIRDLGIYGDELSQHIALASQTLFEFEANPEAERDDDGPLPMPMSVEQFYIHAGFPDGRPPAEHAREESSASPDERLTTNTISAWHLHAGATYWLSWFWNGSEDSDAFRKYRTAANDMLFNPHQIMGRVADDFADARESEVVQSVLGPGRSLSDASEEEIDEIEEALENESAVVSVRTTSESLTSMVEDFEDTEERLARIEEAMGQ